MEQISIFDIIQNQEKYLTLKEAVDFFKNNKQLKANWKEYTFIQLKDKSIISWYEYISNTSYSKKFKQFLFKKP